MKKIDLNGGYKLKFVPYNEDISFVLKEGFTPDGWLDTEVPGDVATTLLKAGLITGDYYGKDMECQHFVYESDWIYYRSFFVGKDFDNEKNRLLFEGIDTLADIFLNGRKIGSSRNMFVPWEADVSGLLYYGKTNILVVRIYSSVKSIEQINRDGLYPVNETDRLLLRKSQMNYGWDFCARNLSVGIWKKACIFCKKHTFIKDYFLYTLTADAESAKLSLTVQVKTTGVEEGLYWEFYLFLNGETVCKKKSNYGQPVIIDVSKPKLWWPRPYGEAVLYDVLLILKKEGMILDKKEGKFGIRTVRLIQDKLPEGGRGFRLEINQKCLFIRGANWVPLRTAYGEIKEEDYAVFIKRAVDANLSMLRVWGGGIYEPDIFFQLCDREGIMVFQDFMFACGVYPQDKEFLAEVSVEAEYVIKSRRNCTSLVIWAGDNEVDQFYDWFAPEKNYRDNKLNRQVIKKALDLYDPSRPYLESSPISPFPEEAGGENPNSSLQGDMHLYYGSLDKNSPVYYKKIREIEPRFMSEFGFSSIPCAQTFWQFNFYQRPLETGKDPWLDQHEAFERFLKNNEHEEMIYFSQYIQAYGLKYWIEYMRSLKGICAGMLYWKFNDPIASNRTDMLFPSLMSVLDFYGREKAAYYYTRRAYEDRIIAFREDTEEGVSVFFCTEKEDREGVLEISLIDFSGKILQHDEKKYDVNPDAATFLRQLPMEEYRTFQKDACYVRAIFRNQDVTVVNRFMLFDMEECFYIRLPAAHLEIREIFVFDTILEFTVISDCYVQDVMVELPDVNAFYSDNFFCMDAGEVKKITVTTGDDASFENKYLKLQARNADCQVLYLSDLFYDKTL